VRATRVQTVLEGEDGARFEAFAQQLGVGQAGAARVLLRCALGVLERQGVAAVMGESTRPAAPAGLLLPEVGQMRAGP
jgi:hypothetical protein